MPKANQIQNFTTKNQIQEHGPYFADPTTAISGLFLT